MGWRDWTGVGERRWKTAPDEQVQPSKTLWDLLQLLIVPVILVGISLWWSASQDSRDKSRADQLRQVTTLNDYIEQMSDLMLNKNLLSSKVRDPVRSVARTVTLTTLRRLDRSRKGEVLRFLREASLIKTSREGGGKTLVDLESADLAFADLSGANLNGANLTNANLTGTDLTRALLGLADLSGANLTSANLTRAFVSRTELWAANLTGANLNGAIFTYAGLQFADLTGADMDANFSDADLTGADLTDANLSGADLTGADLTGADLTGADVTDADLTGATLTHAKGLPKDAASSLRGPVQRFARRFALLARPE